MLEVKSKIIIKTEDFNFENFEEISDFMGASISSKICIKTSYSTSNPDTTEFEYDKETNTFTITSYSI